MFTVVADIIVFCTLYCQTPSKDSDDVSKYYDKFSLKLQGMQVLLAKPGGCIGGEVGSEKWTYMYMYMYVFHINKVSLLAIPTLPCPSPSPPPPPPTPSAGEDWLAACSASTSSSLHIVEPTGFEIFLEHMIWTNDPYLPRYTFVYHFITTACLHVHIHIYVFKNFNSRKESYTTDSIELQSMQQ